MALVGKIGKSLGSATATLLGLGFIIVFLAGPYLIYYVFRVQAYRITELLAALAVLVSIAFLLLAPIKHMRSTAAVVLYGSSYVLATFMWVWSVIIVGSLWGIVVLYAVNMFVGVGTVVSAFAASLLTGHWAVFMQLVVIAVIIFAMRFIASLLEPTVASQ